MKIRQFLVLSPLLLAACAQKPVLLGSPTVTQSGSITNYESQGNLASTHVVGCVGLESASNTWTPADIFPAVNACVHQAEYAKSVELFVLGGSYGRFDAMRVSDASARDAAGVLKMQSMSDFTDEQKAGFQKAAQPLLDDPSAVCAKLRNLGAPNYVPSYMIQHGMSAFLGGQGNGLVKGFDANAAWKSVLRDYVHCKVD